MKTATSIIIVALALSAWTVRSADAPALFEKHCIKCHGADGKGETKMGKKVEVKDLTDAKVQESFTDDKAFKAIKDGIKDGEKTKMKPAEGLTDADMKALVAYMRTFKK